MSDRLEIKAAISVTDAGEITGTAWPFGTADRVGDVITKGAFASSPARLPMLWSHDQSAVIGVWDSISETPAGLQVKGRLLIDSVDKAREVRALVTAGAVNGLSIGFKTKSSTPRRGGGRTISALDLVEISVVAVPSHPDARILSAKSATHTKGKTMENDDIENIETKTVDAAALEEKFTSLETKMSDLGNLGSRLDKIEARLSRPGAPAIISKQADPAELEVKAFDAYCRGQEFDKKALTAGVMSGGGYLVPPNITNALQTNLVQFSPIRSIARVMGTNLPTITLPKRTGISTPSWVGETGPRPESDPVFGSQTISVNETSFYVDVANWLLEDSMFDLNVHLAVEFGEAFGKEEGRTFVAGTGGLQPSGFVNDPSVPVVNAKGQTITGDDLIDCFADLPAYYANRAYWVMNRHTIGEIRKLKTTTGEYLFHDNTGAEASLPYGFAGTLLGRPIIEAVDMPSMAPSTISVAFGDFNSGYLIADRIAMQVRVDPFTQLVNGETRFVGRRRVGGAVVKPEALRLLKTAA